MNLHICTKQTVVGSKRWIIKTPVLKIIVACIEIPEERNKSMLKSIYSVIADTRIAYKAYISAS